MEQDLAFADEAFIRMRALPLSSRPVCISSFRMYLNGLALRLATQALLQETHVTRLTSITSTRNDRMRAFEWYIRLQMCSRTHDRHADSLVMQKDQQVDASGLNTCFLSLTGFNVRKNQAAGDACSQSLDDRAGGSDRLSIGIDRIREVQVPIQLSLLAKLYAACVVLHDSCSYSPRRRRDDQIIEFGLAQSDSCSVKPGCGCLMIQATTHSIAATLTPP